MTIRLHRVEHCPRSDEIEALLQEEKVSYELHVGETGLSPWLDTPLGVCRDAEELKAHLPAIKRHIQKEVP